MKIKFGVCVIGIEVTFQGKWWRNIWKSKDEVDDDNSKWVSENQEMWSCYICEEENGAHEWSIQAGNLKAVIILISCTCALL